MKNIAIIDYGMCNLDSVTRAVERCGGRPQVTDDPTELGRAKAIILPGVGSFSEAMDELRSRSLIELIREMATEGKIPFLGICLGMHLMASMGSEGGKTEGLDIIPGKVVCFEPDSAQTRIPHIGWNEVHQRKESVIFQNIADKTDFYFVHSYHFICDPKYVLGETPYCGEFTSVIGEENRFGVQFHPEKSLKVGLQIITNFLNYVESENHTNLAA